MSLGRDLLDALGPALVPARQVRDTPEGDFDDVVDEDLERASRKLRALSYSCQQGAALLEKILNRRNYDRRVAAQEAET